MPSDSSKKEARNFLGCRVILLQVIAMLRKRFRMLMMRKMEPAKRNQGKT